MSRISRRLAIGADAQPDGSTHFRVWAPRPRDVSVVIEQKGKPLELLELALNAEGDGYYSAIAPHVGPGDRYRFRLDGKSFADPASRFQPEGPFGPSEIVDPRGYEWRDRGWSGVFLKGQVLYELHLGTFTTEGTWNAAAARLADLRAVGITTIELMPVAEFPGRFGWGYDGVFPYAPCHIYGTPDDFRSFVDRAHEIGLGVILDVVYNHLGPSGCVHREFAEAYFTNRYDNEWGEALNFDGEDSGPVREYFAESGAYWIDEYHLDGLRLDALQGIHDRSPDHIVRTISSRAREAAGDRPIIIVAENERQESIAVLPSSQGGYGVDAVWNDDFHHSAYVVLTGHNEAYFSDHRGAPQEFISAAKYGYLFQGQRYAWHQKPRGTRTDRVSPEAFVTYLENHDQVANTGDGSRLHKYSPPGRYRAMTALFLLMPSTPMLFQGQEFGSSSPFLYFADHEGDLAKAVYEGRLKFVQQFSCWAAPEAQARMAAPNDPATFEQCKLRWAERDLRSTYLHLHKDLLAMRRTDPTFSRQQVVDGAVIAPEAFVLRFVSPIPNEERLLVVNLGQDLVAASFPEPLIAPPMNHEWHVLWSSEEPRYGGIGASPILTSDGWRIPGNSATVLSSRGTTE